MKTKTIKLADIVIDAGTQQREKINDDIVAEYAEAIQCGNRFPSITAFFDGVSYYLVDGFHRYHAHRISGITEIETDVKDGTKREAVLFSVGVNSNHGLNRTNADKKKAVLTLLSDKEWVNWSDNEIAKKCSVSQPFVGSVRKSLITVISENPEQRTYINKHGGESAMQTSNIGRKTPDVTNEEKEEPEQEMSKEEFELIELKESNVALTEQNIRLKDALSVNQLPDDVEIQNASEIIDDLRNQVKTLEATLASTESTRDALYVRVRELEKQSVWQLSQLKKAGLLK